MTNKKTTKRALLASILSLLLCMSMLVGSTFAWFTDSVTVGGNKIVSGKLDIELWQTTYNDWMDQPGDEGFVEANITDSETPIFDSELWEPGYLAYTNLTVKNVGTLAAKINAQLVPTGSVGKLAEVIDVYVAYVPFADNYDSYTIRDFFNGEWTTPWGGGMNMFDEYVVHVGTLAEVMNSGINLATYGGEEAVIEAGDNYQVNIALKMRESAGNEYQEQTAGEFDIRILATQAPVEKDSFDENYDKDAEYNEIVSDPAKFEELLLNAPTNGDLLVVKVAEDMEIANSIQVPAGSNVVIDLNGKTLTPGEGTESNGWVFYPRDDANLVITGNGTYDMNGKDVAIVVQGRANITIESGNFINSGKAEAGYTLINGASSQNHPLIIKGGYFDSGFYEEGNCFQNQRTCINSSWGNQVKIYGGTFVGFNPIAGDEGMAFQCPDCVKTAENPGYCQGVFLDGQNWKSEEIPAGYTITESALEDGRPVFTVSYSK